VLLHRIGWSVQVLARRGAGRRGLAAGDAARQRAVAEQGAWLVFEDESGQCLRAPKDRTRGRRGRTPVGDGDTEAPVQVIAEDASSPINPRLKAPGEDMVASPPWESMFTHISNVLLLLFTTDCAPSFRVAPSVK